MSTKTCNNCGMEIPISASICPHCRMDPCIMGQEAFPPGSNEPDPALQACVWGAIMLPVFPVAGGVLLGLGVLGKIASKWRN
jgi:hypothetical protein